METSKCWMCGFKFSLDHLVSGLCRECEYDFCNDFNINKDSFLKLSKIDKEIILFVSKKNISPRDLELNSSLKLHYSKKEIRIAIQKLNSLGILNLDTSLRFKLNEVIEKPKNVSIFVDNINSIKKTFNKFEITIVEITIEINALQFSEITKYGSEFTDRDIFVYFDKFVIPCRLLSYRYSDGILGGSVILELAAYEHKIMSGYDGAYEVETDHNTTL